MSTVHVHATGETFEGVSGSLADYYQGEANTVGGYTIDGVDYPVKAAVPVTEEEIAEAFDPAKHNLDEVQEYLANATPEEQERVLAAERARGEDARVTLVGHEDDGDPEDDEQ